MVIFHSYVNLPEGILATRDKMMKARQQEPIEHCELWRCSYQKVVVELCCRWVERNLWWDSIIVQTWRVPVPQFITIYSGKMMINQLTMEFLECIPYCQTSSRLGIRKIFWERNWTLDGSNEPGVIWCSITLCFIFSTAQLHGIQK